MGEDIELAIPQVLFHHIAYVRSILKHELEQMVEQEGEETAQKWADANLKELEARVMKRLIDNYVKARDEVQEDADNLKKFFLTQEDKPGKTKADVLKELWAELPKYSDKPVPPLDDEMLSELALEPYTEKGELKHNWGTADKLYKSEAIDAFGSRFLLGVYETKAEATKAFEDWNKEYEAARLDSDVAGQERIKKVLEEARR